MKSSAQPAGPGVPVTAFLLYRADETVIATTFLHALNEAVEELGEEFAFAEAGDEAHWLFEGREHHVTIEVGSQRLPGELFEGALKHPFASAVFPAGRAITMGHAAYARIEVGGGPSDELDVEAIEPSDFQPAAILPRLRLLRAVAKVYAKLRFPLAVHWCQCDNLLAGPDFVQMAERGAETELFVTAVPYSTCSETGATYGAVTQGASHVIGREIELSEAAVTPAWAADRLLQFVEQARAEMPPIGQALRFPTDEIVMVHEEEGSEAFPDGHIRLSVEKLPTTDTIVAREEPPMGFLAEMDNRVAARGFGRR